MPGLFGLAGRMAWGGTKMAAGAGFTGAKLGASTAAHLGGAAWMTGKAAYNVGMRSTAWAGRTLGGGGLPLAYKEMSAFGRTFRVPHAFNRATQNALFYGIPAVGVGLGAAGAIAGPRWNVNQAIGTGAVEVERPDFLGATGSLALSLSMGSRQRAGRLVNYDINTGAGNRRVLGLEQGSGMGNYLTPAMYLADDVAMAAIHGVLR